MANEKTIQTRVIQKHDVEANWLKATNFSPKQGEIIIYDIDENYNYERMKIGDGVTNVNDLPFITEKEALSINAVTTGEIVTITDASPLEHEISVKLSGGETLIIFTNMDQGDFQNSDGSSNSEPNGDYVVEDNTDGLITFTDGSSLIVGTDISTTGDVSDNIVAGDIVRLETNIDEGYWQAYLVEEFGDFSTVTLTKYGKNLLSPVFEPSYTSYGGVTFTDNGDGTITVNGTTTTAIWIEFFGKQLEGDPNHAVKKGSYVFNDFKNTSALKFRTALLAFTPNKEKLLEIEHYNNRDFVNIPQDAYLTYQIRISTGAVFDNVILKPQLEIGTTATEYEPYKAETYTPNADGTVDNVTSYYPTTTLITDTDDIIIEAEYIKNVNEVLNVEPTDTASTLVVGANIFDMLRFTKQTLTDAQKAQVIENLGLADYIRSIIQEESETVAQNYLDTTIAEEASW